MRRVTYCILPRSIIDRLTKLISLFCILQIQFCSIDAAFLDDSALKIVAAFSIVHIILKSLFCYKIIYIMLNEIY